MRVSQVDVRGQGPAGVHPIRFYARDVRLLKFKISRAAGSGPCTTPLRRLVPHLANPFESVRPPSLASAPTQRGIKAVASPPPPPPPLLLSSPPPSVQEHAHSAVSCPTPPLSPICNRMRDILPFLLHFLHQNN
ncbi:unnamed protein product [Pleuronectes platessa]|uniref:Uncharacterized protein n=1 Tax=Pleuronectes platessa TaxID=8262 RepID=A0A9N7U1H3_PLEPL|nr:unnamed protein product [Pleuronectes platessa]